MSWKDCSKIIGPFSRKGAPPARNICSLIQSKRLPVNTPAFSVDTPGVSINTSGISVNTSNLLNSINSFNQKARKITKSFCSSAYTAFRLIFNSYYLHTNLNDFRQSIRGLIEAFAVLHTSTRLRFIANEVCFLCRQANVNYLR